MQINNAIPLTVGGDRINATNTVGKSRCNTTHIFANNATMNSHINATTSTVGRDHNNAKNIVGKSCNNVTNITMGNNHISAASTMVKSQNMVISRTVENEHINDINTVGIHNNNATSLTVGLGNINTTNILGLSHIDAMSESMVDIHIDDQNFLCNYCRCDVIIGNYNILCNNCQSLYHRTCYNEVKLGDNFCKLCISKQLPFFTCEIDDELEIEDIVISQAPENIFECFKSKGLHFIHINARSMLHKLPELQYIAQIANPAIIAISETWLDESVTDSEVKIDGYNIIRRDRVTHAGGVCIYVRDKIGYNARKDLQNDTLEDLWLELLFPKTKPLFVGTCYRAPKNSTAKECIETTLNKLPPECDTLLLGDFNYCTLNNKVNKFSQMMTTNGYTQLINTPTRVTNNSSSLIDHIYTNNTDKISQSGVIESGISDHFITFCTRKTFKDTVGKHTRIKIRSMKNYTKDIFVKNLKTKNWDIVK